MLVSGCKEVQRERGRVREDEVVLVRDVGSSVSGCKEVQTQRERGRVREDESRVGQWM